MKLVDFEDIAETNRDDEDAMDSTENVTSISNEEVVASEESTQESLALGGNKRFRKSIEKGNKEDSDEEDFSGSAVPAKFKKRFIDDDDDEDD